MNCHYSPRGLWMNVNVNILLIFEEMQALLNFLHLTAVENLTVTRWINYLFYFHLNLVKETSLNENCIHLNEGILKGVIKRKFCYGKSQKTIGKSLTAVRAMRTSWATVTRLVYVTSNCRCLLYFYYVLTYLNKHITQNYLSNIIKRIFHQIAAVWHE